MKTRRYCALSVPANGKTIDGGPRRAQRHATCGSGGPRGKRQRATNREGEGSHAPAARDGVSIEGRAEERGAGGSATETKDASREGASETENAGRNSSPLRTIFREPLACYAATFIYAFCLHATRPGGPRHPTTKGA
ncbi:Hypothetical protein NTJ_07984 [Nesidiocoris tenuis]|uniref:Uncharacterized protein n=1 Tax=Nesidiocoris tenuis TaxID=355587 RepID=A0ABN7AW50_9HEMI|nr:Hypothetical protein NTJ_07984 [Nesidiocoris tenuis]